MFVPFVCMYVCMRVYMFLRAHECVRVSVFLCIIYICIKYTCVCM